MLSTERHYLIPAKSNTQYEVLSGPPEGCQIRLRISPQARAKAPDLPVVWKARAIRVESTHGQSRVLLTSLFDHRRFWAQDLADCYRRRWEIETSYRELKHSMLGEVLTLRSRLPEGIQQEIWGALIAYNLVQLEMAKAAIEVPVAPTDQSFLHALHIIQHELI